MSPIVASVLARLDALSRNGDTTSEDRALIDRLMAAYQARASAVWTDGTSLLPRAAQAATEIAQAADWGLDPRLLGVPSLPDSGAKPEILADVEARLSLAALKYAVHAAGGRFEPNALSLWLDGKPRPVSAPALLARLAAAPDPATVLRAQHPNHPQFELLRRAYLKERGTAGPAVTAAADDRPLIPPGPLLKRGDTHPHVALLRRRLKVATVDGADPAYFDDELAEALAEALKGTPARALSMLGKSNRAILNEPVARAARETKRGGATADASAKRLLANMERWRWVPQSLGATHIWNNLPEFETRFVRDGRVAHQERIIIGKPDTQTPIFSDAMQFVVFNPDWGVPNSIKVKELLPKLQDGNDDVLERRNMRIMVNGKEVDPGKYDWDKIDIRAVPIVQDPGPANPLGQLKFMFPNKHDVYMHDTPHKGLFNSSVRTFSHGCIRVRNPVRLAEVVFGEDKGWDTREIMSRIGPKADPVSRVSLTRRIPVHNVYFTVIAEPDGQLRSVPDVYGHDRRLIQALEGRPLEEIASEDPARIQKREVEEALGLTAKQPTKPTSLARAPSVGLVPQNQVAGVTVWAPYAPAPLPPSALGGPVPRPAAVKPPPAAVYKAPSASSGRLLSPERLARDGL